MHGWLKEVHKKQNCVSVKWAETGLWWKAWAFEPNSTASLRPARAAGPVWGRLPSRGLGSHPCAVKTVPTAAVGRSDSLSALVALQELRKCGLVLTLNCCWTECPAPTRPRTGWWQEAVLCEQEEKRNLGHMQGENTENPTEKD